MAMPIAALGDGYSLRVSPSFQITTTKATDATGQTQESENWSFGRQYQLTIDKTLYGTVRLSTGGSLRDVHTELTAGPTRFESDQRAWNGNVDLLWGTEILSGGFGYARTDTSASSGDVLTQTARSGVETERWTAFSRWQPIDLPSLHLSLERANQRAAGRDSDSLLGAVGAAYKPVSPLDLRYDLSYGNLQDNRSLVETSTVGQTARATYSDTLFERTSVYLAYNFTTSSLTTRVGGPGGTVTVQRSPVAGYSLVAPFGTQPESNALVVNPAVIDGSVGASVGIDIGFARTAAGDTNLREVGVQFADVTQPVNMLYVWVDRELPPGVSGDYAWSVFRSDDNLVWIPVSIVRAVVFGAFENRFEIAIADTSARYVKVVTRPLRQGVTVDPVFSSIFVTEMQALLVRPASAVEGKTTSTQDALSGNASTRILSIPSLRHDVTFSLARPSADRIDWTLQNGLSLSHALNPKVGISSRIARSDAKSGDVHVGQLQYAAGVTATPLPTLSSGASFSGSLTQDPAGTSVANGVSGYARAQLYTGIDVDGNAGFSIATSAADRTTRSTVASASLSLVPHRLLALSASAATSRAQASGGGDADATTTSTRFDAGVSSSPTSALFASAGVSRVLGTGQRPNTLASFTVSWSPLRGGDLKLSLSHNQGIDTAAAAVSRNTQASVRWRVFSYLHATMGYASSSFDTLQSEAESRSFFANLSFTLS
jgi:hypothetical protein